MKRLEPLERWNGWNQLYRERRRLHCAQFHLLQHRSTEQTVGIADCLEHFEMVVALAYEKFYRLARFLHRRGEIAVLPLELGCFERPVGDDDRGEQFLEVTLR